MRWREMERHETKLIQHISLCNSHQLTTKELVESTCKAAYVSTPVRCIHVYRATSPLRARNFSFAILRGSHLLSWHFSMVFSDPTQTCTRLTLASFQKLARQRPELQKSIARWNEKAGNCIMGSTAQKASHWLDRICWSDVKAWN
jgi:hypothetical protein